MNYLWSLVHSLQVFSYLLYMNINFPNNLNSFVEYLQIANGGLPELEQYIPDVSEYIIDQTEIE